jgi:hypothetical protein
MRRLLDRRPGCLEFIPGREDIVGMSKFLLAHQRNTNVKLVEPPSCSPASSIVFIGKNSRGQWVAREQHGLYGGLFVNRAQAVKYALFENGHHLETIVELPREIELEIGGKPGFGAADARRAA